MIRKLRLENFKCFENQAFHFCPLTLLTGLNGVGKSSVLQSLLVLRQSYQEGLLAGTGLMLKGDLVTIGTGVDALFEGAEVDVIALSLAVRNGGEENLEGQWHFACDLQADVLELILDYELDEDLYDDALFQDDFHYLQAERVGPRLFYDSSDFHVRRHQQLGTRGEYTAHFLASFGDAEIPNKGLSHKNAISMQLRAQVEAWMSEVSPGARIHLTPNLEMDVIGLQYSFEVGKQVSNHYRPTNVGFGISYLLPVLVAILSSRPGSLLLIENPEAHLHPRGQSTIGRLLALAAGGGIQILVETHSDHVLNGIRIAVHDGELKPDDVQIHFFQKREEDGKCEVISPQIDRDGRLDQWPDGFFDEFDKNLDILLQPRKE